MQGVCEGLNRVFRWEAHQQPDSKLYQWQVQKRGTITDSQVLIRGYALIGNKAEFLYGIKH